MCQLTSMFDFAIKHSICQADVPLIIYIMLSWLELRGKIQKLIKTDLSKTQFAALWGKFVTFEESQGSCFFLLSVFMLS